ncbi:MAG: serine acetyltransferase [Pseudomonadota bacterium]
MRHSPTEPDWSREEPRRFWDPSRRLLRAIRRYQAAGPLARRYWVLSHRFWSMITQADIPLNTRIGGGLLLPHPNGVVIHPKSVIGPNCILFQQATLGTTRNAEGAPVLGGDVFLGAGARVLGPVTIGDHAMVGANAVVMKDVAGGALAVGIPARIVDQAGTA